MRNRSGPLLNGWWRAQLSAHVSLGRGPAYGTGSGLAQVNYEVAVLVGLWTPAGLSLPVSFPVNLSTQKIEVKAMPISHTAAIASGHFRAALETRHPGQEAL